MKALITWLGEDAEHENDNGPRHNHWGGLKFTLGTPVEVSNETMIRKAQGNCFFDVQIVDPVVPQEDSQTGKGKGKGKTSSEQGEG